MHSKNINFNYLFLPHEFLFLLNKILFIKTLMVIEDHAKFFISLLVFKTLFITLLLPKTDTLSLV